MKIGICTDHGGYALKQIIHELLIKLGYDIVDFGAFEHDDDYTDFVIHWQGQLRPKMFIAV